MIFSRHHSNSHGRHRRAIRWNWSRRARERWSQSGNRWARRRVLRVFASLSVRAWQLNSTLELRLKIHAIEVREIRRKLITNSHYTRSLYRQRTTGSSTLPRPTTKATEADLIRSDKPVTTASTTSLYDNVASGNQSGNQQGESE